MKKPFIKRRLFLQPSSERKKQKISSDPALLPFECLNEVSIFETLRAYEGSIFHLDRHLERFQESCNSVNRKVPIPVTELRDWVEAALQESGFPSALLRFSLHWVKMNPVGLVIMIRPFEGYPEKVYKEGVVLRTSGVRQALGRMQGAQIKCSDYVGAILAHLDKGDLKAHELLFINQEGMIVEGTVSNIFLIPQTHGGPKSGSAKTLLTPAVPSGILRGVTRDVVLEIAFKEGFQVEETCLTRHDLYNTQECFMTNTSSEVLPVVMIDNRKIGCGAPGPMTNLLREAFRQKVRKR